MQHIELHTLDSEKDAIAAGELGLIEIELTEFCENCDQRVGYADDGSWIQCSVLLTDVDDEDVVYLVCNECTDPILSPLNF